jgi:thioredoxin reductase
MKKEALVELWADIRAKVDIPYVEGQTVEALSRDPDGMWRLKTQLSERRAANVILALGRRGSPNKIGCPGEELSKVAYRLLEPEVFKGQHVLVVGGGNSAVENAIALAQQGGCASVAISYRKTEFARCRGENKRLIAELIKAGRVAPLMPTNVTRIGERDVSVKFEDGREQTFANDAVIVQIGGTSPADLLQSFGIHMVTKHAQR